MRKNRTKKLALLIFAVAASGLAVTHAQTGNDGPTGDGSSGDQTIQFDPDTQEVPLDGGLVLLLAAGAGYGLKKYRSAQQQQNREETDASQL